MRSVVLFIAMSLDGYIADRDGKVDWLAGQAPDQDDLVTYADFIQTVDTVVMGWETYHQITTELSPGRWIYEGLESYVVTHRLNVSAEEVQFVTESPGALVGRLKQAQGKDIWICGGANLAQQCMRDHLVDRYHISVLPVILGGGIPLFGALERAVELRLVSTKHYNGITDLVYERRKKEA